MKTNARLRSLFGTLIQGTLLASAACNGQVDPTVPFAGQGIEGFGPVACTPPAAGDRGKPDESALLPELGVDSVSVYALNEVAGGASRGVGTECAGAADLPRCGAAIAAAKTTFNSACERSANNCLPNTDPPPKIYITTAAGAVRASSEPAKIFGTIDSSAKAAFLAEANGYTIFCERTTSIRAASGGGYELIVNSGYSCGGSIDQILVAPDGSITRERSQGFGCAGTGRRPAGLQPARPCRAPSGIGRHFADMAYLEAASVCAFERLEAELVSLGAPKRLQRAACRAASDEVRHARVMTALAHRYGATSAVPRVQKARARSAERIARENAVEGCVRETYGALLATWQSALAGDHRIARAMRQIARDETRHAALSWDIAGWLEPRLSPAARRRVEAARLRAAHELSTEVTRDRPRPAAEDHWP